VKASIPYILTLPNLIVLLSEFSIGIHTNSLSVIILLMGSQTKNSIGKMLIGNFLYVSESIVNKFTDDFKDITCAPKKITRFIPPVIPR